MRYEAGHQSTLLRHSSRTESILSDGDPPCVFVCVVSVAFVLGQRVCIANDPFTPNDDEEQQRRKNETEKTVLEKLNQTLS